MSRDILLAKPVLPEGHIDCSVGEAYVVRDALDSIFDLNSYRPTTPPRWDYPFPNGYPPLVKLLEDKYQAPVVICNGAKQALGASFYALHKMGKRTMGMRSPYWALIPPLATMHGLSCVYDDEYQHDYESYLMVAPSNPDGWMTDYLWDRIDYMRENVIPVIHDGAYYSHVYLPPSCRLRVLSDVQIYSASKSFGLSAIRLGWAVCQNQEMYHHIQEYMEAMTVGVSILPQMFLYDLMLHMEHHPQMVAEFEQKASDALYQSKKLMLQVDPEVLRVPENLPDVPGMFGFFEVGPKADFDKARINVANGVHFGAPGFVRINLAHPVSTMEEIVHRLNSCVSER